MRKPKRILLLLTMLLLMQLWTSLQVLRLSATTSVAQQELHTLQETNNKIRNELIKTKTQLQNLRKIWDELEIGRFEATAYAPHDNQSGICADSTPNTTATGTMPGKGTFAVNPEVIPYGSRMLIIGNGWFEHGKALDTGGAMLNSTYKVDLYRRTHEDAINFGRQQVLVIFLPNRKDT